MADQKLVAIYHVLFLVEQSSYLIKQTCNCWTKLVLWYILITFPHNHGSMTLFVYVFKEVSKRQ